MGGLLHPLLAFGVLGASVPLIIHLLNRRRHQPLDWAAMRFARVAWKRIRRRTRFENLLLLVLRMAAVALFALALARPFTQGMGPLAGLSREHREVVILLDGSASMGYSSGLTSLWDRALERARAVLEELDGGEGDRARLYLVGERTRALSGRSPEEALSMLTSLESPLAEGFDLNSALTRTLDDLEREGIDPEARPELILITDVQRSNFLGPEGALAQESLERLEERGLELTVDDVTKDDDGFTRRPANLTVTDFVPLDPFGEPLTEGASAAYVLKSGASTSFLIEVANSGETGRDVNVALLVDGERRPSKRLFVPGAGSARIELEARLAPAGTAPADSQGSTGSGFHELEATLEADSLPIDDRRSLIALAPGTLEVLLVNGAPSADFESDELAYLRATLEPPEGTAQGPFALTERTPQELAGGLDLGPFDLIWLANVEDPSPELADALEARVAAGATLVVSLGDHVTPGRYNERLGSLGLLPVELAGRKGDPSRRGSFRRARIDAPEHPALRFFRDERYSVFLTEVPVFEYFSSAPLPGARVLASLDDEVTSGSPLLVERDHGRGRTVLFTTTIDNDWALFAQSPTSLIPLVHELVFGSVRASGPPLNLSVGDPINAHFSSFPEAPSLVMPSGAATRIDTAAVELPPGDPDAGMWSLAARASADRPGIWHVTTRSESAAFSVALDPREGQLERLPRTELTGLSPVFRFESEEAPAGIASTEDGELFRWLLGLALLALVAEALWARHLTRERA